jgi:tripartite-type tricarboxylate transporter receptor subunit TctC
MFQKITHAFFAGIICVLSFNAWAQGFNPTAKTIEIVVPYPPGGATDKWSRTIDEIFLAQGWKSVVVNKPGADTVIGSNYVAAARADGHTLYVGGNGFLDANIAFKQRAPGIEYTENSFEPILPLGAGTAVLVVGKNVPVNTYEEFKQYVKKNPEKFNLGFWNTYTGNIFYEWAKKEGLPRPNIVFYKGSAPQVADVLGGHIPFVFDTYTAMAPHYRAGNVKIIAALDRRGVDIVKKDVPQAQLVSIASRVPGVDVPIWYGLYAPAGTPKETVARINALLNHALQDPKYSRNIENLHIGNFGGTPEDQRRVQTNVLTIMRNVAKSIEQ